MQHLANILDVYLSVYEFQGDKALCTAEIENLRTKLCVAKTLL